MKTAEAHNAGLTGKIEFPDQTKIVQDMTRFTADIIKDVLAVPPSPDAAPIEQIAWFDDRVYRRTLADKRMASKWSVTTKLGIINKPFLSRWRGDLGNDAADRRSNYGKWRGSRIHDNIHHLIENGVLPWDRTSINKLEQDEWLCLLRYEKFLRLFKPRILGSEIVVWKDSYSDVASEEPSDDLVGYAGTMDHPCILEVGKYPITKQTVIEIPETGYYVGDIKTGILSKEHNYQTALYARADEGQTAPDQPIFKLSERYGVPVGTFILHLDADNKEGYNVKVRNKEQMEHDYQMGLYSCMLWDDNNPNKTPTFFDMPTVIHLEPPITKE